MSQSRQVQSQRMSIDDQRHALDVVLFDLIFQNEPHWESRKDTVDQCILKLNQARETEHPIDSALQLLNIMFKALEEDSGRQNIVAYAYMAVLKISDLDFFDSQDNAHTEAATNPYLLDLSRCVQFHYLLTRNVDHIFIFTCCWIMCCVFF